MLIPPKRQVPERFDQPLLADFRSNPAATCPADKMLELIVRECVHGDSRFRYLLVQSQRLPSITTPFATIYIPKLRGEAQIQRRRSGRAAAWWNIFRRRAQFLNFRPRGRRAVGPAVSV